MSLLLRSRQAQAATACRPRGTLCSHEEVQRLVDVAICLLKDREAEVTVEAHGSHLGKLLCVLATLAVLSRVLR